MKEIFLALSVVSEIAAYLFYARAILKKEARPHRTTRFVLLILSNLTVLSLFAQSNSVAIWLAGVYALFSWLLFLLSFKYGMGGWSKTDILCLVIALFGIVTWKITNNPALALYSAIFADFTGMIPTLIKSYYHPKTEVWYFFFLAGFGAGLNLLAIHEWTLQQYAFPLYILLINIVMVSLLLRSKRLI